MQTYWDKKNRVNGQYFDTVAWDAINMEMKSPNKPSRIWIVKRASGECGANKVLHRRKMKENDQCPFCGQTESAQHVYQCQHNAVQEKWNQLLHKFKGDLQEMSTDPDIIQQLCEGIEQWPKGHVPQVTDIIHYQNNIGWNGFIEGIISDYWQNQQEEYYQHIQSKKSGLQWEIKIIRKLWIIAWEIWQHRNTKEHDNDIGREKTKLIQAVQEAIDRGGEGNIDATHMFSDNEIQKVVTGSNGYIRGWLRNLDARRAYRERDGNIGLQQMRHTLHRFLHSS
jgi:hypothetical protein